MKGCVHFVERAGWLRQGGRGGASTYYNLGSRRAGLGLLSIDSLREVEGLGCEPEVFGVAASSAPALVSDLQLIAFPFRRKVTSIREQGENMGAK